MISLQAPGVNDLRQCHKHRTESFRYISDCLSHIVRNILSDASHLPLWLCYELKYESKLSSHHVGSRRRTAFKIERIQESSLDDLSLYVVK
jgi:hypothetical protein